MKIVVTGALGHIGSRLIRELPFVFEDAEIVMLDNLATQRFSSLFNLPPQGHYHFVEGDVLNTDLISLFEGTDVVVHLAAITNATDSFSIRDQVEKVNFNSTRRVADACAATGSAMIFLSTTSVYGTQRPAVDENCSVEDLKPQSPYAEIKLKEEYLLQSLGDTRNLRFIICRFGTIAGASPGMRFHTAVNKFCWQAMTRQPLTVWRLALHQKRPYLVLDDAIRALEFIIQNRCFDRRIYNVLTENLTVDVVLKFIQSDVPNLEIKYVDSEIMNQFSYEVLSDRFRGLGFEFTGNIQTSIKETIELLQFGRCR
jgi:nucleoside-diphosphate-sugar epimerase